MASTMVADFFARLGFKSDTSGLTKFQDSLGHVSRGLSSLKSKVIAVAGAGGLGYLIKSAAETTKELHKMGDRLGLTAQEANKVHIMAKLTGTDVNTLEAAISKLNKKIIEAARGNGQAAADFFRFGINIKDANGRMLDAVDILPQVAGAIEKTGNKTRKTVIATALFQEQGLELLPVLNQGSAALRRFTQEADSLTFVTDDNIKKSKEFHQRMGLVSATFSQLYFKMKFTIVNALLPLVKEFEHFIKTNKEAIHSGIHKSMEVLHNIFAALGKAVHFVVSVFSAFFRIIKAHPKAIAAITIAITALALALGFLKIKTIAVIGLFTSLIAIIGGVVLIYEDYLTFIRGGESVVGKLLDSNSGKWRALGKVILGIGVLVKGVFTIIEKTLEAAWFLIKKIMDGIKWVVDKIAAIIPKSNGRITVDAKLPGAGFSSYASRAVKNAQAPVVNNNNVTIRSSPTINVPAGTTEEQVRLISSRLEARTEQLFQTRINQAASEFPQVE